MSVIVSSLACKCGGIMVKSLLFDGRQQRVRRPSNDGCDDRQQCGWRPSHNKLYRDNEVLL